MLGGDREGQALPFAEGLRLALEGQGEHWPVARAAKVDLADLAEEDQALDGGGEPVRARGNSWADGQGLGADRDGDRRAVGISVTDGAEVCPIRRPNGVRTMTSPRARRSPRPGLGPGSSARGSGRRRRRPGGCRPRCGGPDWTIRPRSITARRSARARASRGSLVSTRVVNPGLGVEPADLVAELVANAGLEPAERLVEDQELGLRWPGRGPARRAGAVRPRARPARRAARVSIRKAFSASATRSRRSGRPSRCTARAVADVLRNRHPGPEGVVLKHHADLALLRREVVDDPVVEVDLAVVERSPGPRSGGRASSCPLRRDRAAQVISPALRSSDAPSTTATRS